MLWLKDILQIIFTRVSKKLNYGRETLQYYMLNN